MQMPSTDRSHELFWRQVARWLSASTPDPVSSTPLTGVLPGNAETLSSEVRTNAFEPVCDADVLMHVTMPGGEVRDVRATDRKSTRLNSSHANISYAVFCLKKKKKRRQTTRLTS